MVGGALGISTAPILVALSQAAPTQAAFWRFAYALPVLLALCLVRPAGRRSFSRRGWIAAAALSGLFFAADMDLWHHSIGLIGAGPSTLLANTQIVWLALFGLLFLGERPSRLFWLTLPVIALGLLLLTGEDSADLRFPEQRAGLLFGLAAGFCYAGALICLRRSQRAAPVLPEATLVMQLSVGVVALALVGAVDGSLPATLSAQQHGWLLLLGLVAQVASWMAITTGIKHLPGHHGGLLLLSQPVSSLCLGWWILDQSLAASRIAGAGLILCGVAAALFAESRARESLHREDSSEKRESPPEQEA
ncbi:MAG: DMT family transporter [bacterium]|nr:DMT family transporter [bacterium]